MWNDRRPSPSLFPIMKAILQGKLEAKIQEFMDENCEGECWPQDSWMPDDLAGNMRDAAVAVFNASVSSSKYTYEQENP